MSESERNLTSWRRQAACRDMDTDVFFPLSDEEAGPAKAVCATCPVRAECLEFALATNQEAGVWGATSEEERRKLRKAWLARRRRAS